MILCKKKIKLIIHANRKKKQTLHENALLQNYFLIVTTFSRQVEFSEDTSFYKKCDN